MKALSIAVVMLALSSASGVQAQTTVGARPGPLPSNAASTAPPQSATPPQTAAQATVQPQTTAQVSPEVAQIKYQASSGAPNVVVLVAAMQSGDNQVAITYPKVRPRDQVQRDLETLKSLTGWSIRNAEISNERTPIGGHKELMTSLSFSAKNVVEPNSHAFVIEPIVTALRGNNHIVITYLMNGRIDYNGLRDYRDKNVAVSFEQNGPACTYHIKLLNPQFQKLNLPLYQPAASTIRTVQDDGRRPIKPWQVALIAVLAAAAGGAVYMAMAKHS